MDKFFFPFSNLLQIHFKELALVQLLSTLKGLAGYLELKLIQVAIQEVETEQVEVEKQVQMQVLTQVVPVPILIPIPIPIPMKIMKVVPVVAQMRILPLMKTLTPTQMPVTVKQADMMIGDDSQIMYTLVLLALDYSSWASWCWDVSTLSYLYVLPIQNDQKGNMFSESFIKYVLQIHILCNYQEMSISC